MQFRKVTQRCLHPVDVGLHVHQAAELRVLAVGALPRDREVQQQAGEADRDPGTGAGELPPRPPQDPAKCATPLRQFEVCRAGRPRPTVTSMLVPGPWPCLSHGYPMTAALDQQNVMGTGI